jgi:H/ACA ribonucleoprotein complex subunit 2
VVIAADISPMDVISHLPVLCEDHAVPYIYVTSRTELGAAGSTKRPTSVVLITKDKGKAKKKDAEAGEEKEDWDEVYQDLVKIVKRAAKDVRI